MSKVIDSINLQKWYAVQHWDSQCPCCRFSHKVSVNSRYLGKKDHLKISAKIKEKIQMEKQMDYFQMVQAIREGGKARRPTWNKDEWVWSDGKILIHTTPYWTNEEKNKQIQGFPYVCEQVDVTARDWEYCAV